MGFRAREVDIEAVRKGGLEGKGGNSPFFLELREIWTGERSRTEAGLDMTLLSRSGEKDKVAVVVSVEGKKKRKRPGNTRPPPCRDKARKLQRKVRCYQS